MKLDGCICSLDVVNGVVYSLKEIVIFGDLRFARHILSLMSLGGASRGGRQWSNVATRSGLNV
jgi:hypothetical protein